MKMELEEFPNSFTDVEEEIVRYLYSSQNAKSARNISDNSNAKASYYSVKKACEKMVQENVLKSRKVENGKADKLYYLPKINPELIEVKD